MTAPTPWPTRWAQTLTEYRFALERAANLRLEIGRLLLDNDQAEKRMARELVDTEQVNPNTGKPYSWTAALEAAGDAFPHRELEVLNKRHELELTENQAKVASFILNGLLVEADTRQASPDPWAGPWVPQPQPQAEPEPPRRSDMSRVVEAVRERHEREEAERLAALRATGSAELTGED